MGNFSQGGSSGGFRSGGRDNRNDSRDGGRQGGFQKKSFGGRDSGNKEQMMHQATCSECGKRCEVPFRPVNGKPVYCTDCFSAKRGASTGDSRGDRVPAKSHYENRDNRGGGSDDGVKRQLSEMNIKIDRLVKAIETLTGTGTKSVPSEAPKKPAFAKSFSEAKPASAKSSGEAMEKKSVDVVELKKVLDNATGKATEKEGVKTKKVAIKEEKVAPKKVAKKAVVVKKKK